MIDKDDLPFLLVRPRKIIQNSKWARCHGFRYVDHHYRRAYELCAKNEETRKTTG